MKLKAIAGALCTCLVAIPFNTNAAPVVYTDEALYLSDLASLGYSVISESFEDGAVWAHSRNIAGGVPSVTSQGIVWTSNYTDNNIATGTVGGSAPDGQFAVFSLPHGMLTDSAGLNCDNDPVPFPDVCFQNDGLKITSEAGDTLYAFGGRIDTAIDGKVSFLLDGVDINAGTGNPDNVNREGELADNWDFVGVIDTDGFLTAEIRELRGKDSQQVRLFADDFSIGVTAIPVPAAAWLFGSGLIGLFGLARRKTRA